MFYLSCFFSTYFIFHFVRFSIWVFYIFFRKYFPNLFLVIILFHLFLVIILFHLFLVIILFHLFISHHFIQFYFFPCSMGIHFFQSSFTNIVLITSS
jgi:hypothetical protein